MEFILIFFVSYLLIYLIKSYAHNIGLIDIPNQRSDHKKVMPRGGGIGFFLSITLILTLFHFENFIEYIWVYGAILSVFMVGVYDDLYETSSKIKFIVLILASVILFFNDIKIDDIGTFFGLAIHFGWFSIFFTIFAVVGFTNALNLIDGLDGLAGGISIIILATFFFIGYQHQDNFIMIISLATISGLSAFLILNWSPASIFMGDSGSLTLGFMISLLAIKSLLYISTISILFITAIPIFDTLIVMTRRKLHGCSMFSADKCHFHHIMKEFFDGDTKQTVIFLLLMQTIYSLTGLQLDKDIDEGLLLIQFILNTVLLYMALRAMIKRQKRDCFKKSKD